MFAVLFFSKMSCVEGVVQRLKTYGDPDLKFDVKVTATFGSLGFELIV